MVATDDGVIDLLDPASLEWGDMGMFSEGEVIGADRQGHVAAWSNARGEPYLTGATLADVEVSGLAFVEMDRLDRDANVLGVASPESRGPAPGM
jgi:hypothetical protein